MPLYQLTRDVAFPNPNRAMADGLLAVGGDLREERLIAAYSQGIFPWYSEGEPILWWSPDPRMLLLPEEFHLPRRFARFLRTTSFRVTLDQDFEAVIEACSAVPRPGQDGTWITRDMIRAYIRLHDRGFAHSVECWDGEELVGGVYGVSLGACFFGESMFAHRTDASKTAFARLVELLQRRRFTLIDCQVHTGHLERLGARQVRRKEFLRRLKAGMTSPTRVGPWSFDD